MSESIEPALNESFVEDFHLVEKAELDWIKQRRQASGQREDAPLVGLALSGGGIRSATFNLGILQALSKKKLLAQVDVISSVSGGGYIAACFHWIRNHVKPDAFQIFTDTPVDTPIDHGKQETVLDWLRGHGDYLIAGKGFSYWQLVASIIAGTLLNLIVLLPLFLWAMFAASNEWISLGWPQWMGFSVDQPLQKHDGFLLMFWTGIISIALYLLTVFGFALTGLIPYCRRLSQRYFFRRNMGRLLGLGVAALGIGLLPFFAGIEHWLAARFSFETPAELARHLTYFGPLVLGFLTLRASRNRDPKANTGQVLPVIGLSLLVYGLFVLLYHIVNHTGLIASDWFLLWTGVSVLLAFTADVNAISMHSYYRSRLALAFMPRIKTSDGEPLDPDAAMDYELSQMNPNLGAPLPLINTTMNTTSSGRQKLRSRGGDNFVLSPLYCGSTHTGYRLTQDYSKGRMTLSTAFSVSGAAVDPNTYATNSRPVAFLMALLNFRLGYWSDHPNPKIAPRPGRSASWYRLMLREMFAIKLAETEPQIHLSDGGHFENLGLYELFRRRCRYIISGDAGADLENTLSDLGKVIQRARADFGVEVDIDILAFKDDAKAVGCACRVGSITYSDGSKGELLYIKAQIQPQLSADVFAYWRNNQTFPDQSTADQFFDEWQFDSYRQLGYQITEQVIGDSTDIIALFKHEHADEIVE